MTLLSLRDLVLVTVTSPAGAARRLIDMRLGRDVLMLAFSLAVILNTLVQSAANFGLPMISPDVQFVAEPMSRTLVVSIGAIMISVLTFLLIGRLIGGTGSFNEVMTLVVWLQVLQIVAQAIILLLAIALPILYLPCSVALLVLSLYITLHFLNEVHQFQSLGKSFLVMLISGVVAVPFVLLLYPAGPV